MLSYINNKVYHPLATLQIKHQGQKMKIKIDKEFPKRVLYCTLLISVITILLDLYVPIKMMIIGNKLRPDEILSHIGYLHHFPFILFGSLIIGAFSGERIEESRKK